MLLTDPVIALTVRTVLMIPLSCVVHLFLINNLYRI